MWWHCRFLIRSFLFYHHPIMVTGHLGPRTTVSPDYSARVTRPLGPCDFTTWIILGLIWLSTRIILNVIFAIEYYLKLIFSGSYILIFLCIVFSIFTNDTNVAIMMYIDERQQIIINKCLIRLLRSTMNVKTYTKHT